MAQGDHWLLMRLAAQNVGRQPVRALFLGAAVMLGVGIGFVAFVAGWSLREGIATSFSRMGADLLVVPRATLVNLTASLLTVQPTDATLPSDLGPRIAAIAGVARLAPQRIVPAMVDGRRANLIAFDPAHDFSVLTWLRQREAGLVEGLIAGGALGASAGGTLSVCGMPQRLYGRLGKTGVGPFDEAYFLSFDTLAEIAAFCRGSERRTAVAATEAAKDVAAAAGASHADACPADLPLDRVSAFLLQLSPDAKMQDVKFALAQLPDLKVVEGNAVLTSSRQALSTLLVAIAAFIVLELVAVLILVALLFSAIVQERQREVGLLRAMGARPRQVVVLVLIEAGIVTGLGGLAGLVLGTAVLLTGARLVGSHVGLIGVPLAWPPLAVLQTGALIALAVSAALGVVGALLPAWRVRRLAPYELIQAEGH
jgi:putative ABC transport system permease protein